MSILSEQSVKSPGPDKSSPETSQTHSSEAAAEQAQLPQMGVTQDLSSAEPSPSALSSAASMPSAEDKSMEGPQQQLHRLSLHPAIHGGDLAAAAAVITQVLSEIMSLDRASFWLCGLEQHFNLVNRFEHALNLHSSGLTLSVAEYAPYFEGLDGRSGLRVEMANDLNLPVTCLAKKSLILHEPGSLLEAVIRCEGKVVGALWCERSVAHRWTALENATALSAALLAATAVSAQRQQSITSELTKHRYQLKRETIEREQAEQAWQESQRFIQGIIDASTNILYVDSFTDGSNFYINRWVKNVLGYDPYDVQKLGARYLEQLVHADDKPLMVAERRKLLAINDGEVVENEYRFRHRQGNWRWLLCRETVFQRDEEGNPTQIFGTATDITKHKHAEVALKEFNAELERLARMDGLTQVANRRSFDEYLAQEWENIGSGRSALSLILCDIDYFKSFNDTYGHQAGDVCLRQVAKAIEQAVKRSTDLVARYGGEEFAIVLPNTSLEGVKQVAKEIQREIKALNIPHSQSEVSNCITLSLGIASMSTKENTHPDMLVACADQGLYQAKYDGRNRFCMGEIECP
ncbi:MAG: sensor domain-containing diguanylate cyclase [Cyanobacteria bacterium J06623_5]